MSRPLAATDVLPFFGLLYREDISSLENILESLNTLVPIDFNLNFELRGANLRNYYEKEMGAAEKLKRVWLFGSQKVPREDLIKLKLEANKLELAFIKKFDTTGRVVNIDPGFVALEQVVLSTFKPYGHRILLRDNVYAELTYQFQGGEFHDLPWTYPDYRESTVKEHFADARSALKSLL